MISKSLEETRKIAADFAAGLRAKRRGLFGLRPARATVVALSGDLGSGKTTFVKAVAAAFGVPEGEVTSPTFVIMKGYDVAGSPLAQKAGFARLIHIDAYRLESPQQAVQIGWDAIAADPKNLVLVEWPEKLGEKMPKAATRIEFRFVDDVTREIEVQS